MFEILTLSRVFEATNQLKLALKIISFDVNELSMDEYDVELKNLVKKIYLYIVKYHKILMKQMVSK